MSAADLRPVLGFYRLTQRLNRRFLVSLVFIGLCLPLIVQLAFGHLLDARGRTRLLVGNLVFGLLMVSMRRVSLGMTIDRVFGHRDLLATTGLSRGGYLAGMALDGLTTGLLPLGMLVLAFVPGGVGPPVAWTWLPVYLLGLAALVSLGAWLGCVFESMPALVLATNLVVMGGIAFCPVTYPSANVPAWLQPLVGWLPPSLAAESLAAAWRGEAVGLARPLALAVWALLFGALTLRAFPWTDAVGRRG